MPSIFDEFFYNYCQLQRADRQTHTSVRPNALLTCLIALLIILISGIVLMSTQCECNTHVIVGCLIPVCVLFIIAREDEFRRDSPNSQEHSDHIAEVVELLDRYNIAPNDPNKIKELIDYIMEVMERRNPVSEITKDITSSGAAIAIVWSVLANSLNSFSSLNDYCMLLVMVALCVIGGSFILKVLWNITVFILFPQKKRYQQLLDDLKQITIFYRE